MTKADHLEYLASLEKDYGRDTFGLAIQKREGAFYFGHDVGCDEYVEKYREQCVKEGWIKGDNKLIHFKAEGMPHKAGINYTHNKRGGYGAWIGIPLRNNRLFVFGFYRSKTRWIHCIFDA